MNSRNQKISLGAMVRIAPQHWLRPYEEAVVVDFTPGDQNNWLVKFDSGYPGGGIDGDKLWLDESQLTEVKHTTQDFGLRRTQSSMNIPLGCEGRSLQ